jgi:ABC-type Fe3+/spermidine/putrescine transport system ATPase subunit
MRSGRVEQDGTPSEIYRFPRTAFVADFVGSSNLVSGQATGGDGGTVRLRTADGHAIQGVTHGRPVGTEGTLSVRTVHLALSADQPSDPVNVWPVTIIRAVFLGDITQLHVQWGSRELVVRQIGASSANAGQKAWLRAAPEHCILLDPSS